MKLDEFTLAMLRASSSDIEAIEEAELLYNDTMNEFLRGEV